MGILTGKKRTTKEIYDNLIQPTEYQPVADRVGHPALQPDLPYSDPLKPKKSYVDTLLEEAGQSVRPDPPGPQEQPTREDQAFDPEGIEYDYESAIKAGLEADETQHWESRVPETGLLLKGRNHDTWNKTVEAEKIRGNKIIKRDGRYYSLEPDQFQSEEVALQKPELYPEYSKRRKEGLSHEAAINVAQTGFKGFGGGKPSEKGVSGEFDYDVTGRYDRRENVLKEIGNLKKQVETVNQNYAKNQPVFDLNQVYQQKFEDFNDVIVDDKFTGTESDYNRYKKLSDEYSRFVEKNKSIFDQFGDEVTNQQQQDIERYNELLSEYGTLEYDKQQEERGALGNLKESFKGGLESASIDMMFYDSMMGGINPDVALKIKAEYERRLQANPIDANNWLESLANATAEMVGPMSEGIREGMGIGLGAAGAAIIAGQAGPQALLPEELITAPIAYAAGTAAGAGLYWYKQGSGNMYAALLEEGVDEDVAKPVAMAAGIPYAVLEFLQVGKIAKKVFKINKVPEKVIANTVAKVIFKVGKKLGKNVFRETSEELLQEITQIASDEIGKELNNQLKGTELAHVKTDDAIQRVFKTGQGAIGPLSVLLIPGHAANMITSVRGVNKFNNEIGKIATGLGIEKKNALNISQKIITDINNGEDTQRSIAKRFSEFVVSEQSKDIKEPVEPTEKPPVEQPDVEPEISPSEMETIESEVEKLKETDPELYKQRKEELEQVKKLEKEASETEKPIEATEKPQEAPESTISVKPTVITKDEKKVGVKAPVERKKLGKNKVTIPDKEKLTFESEMGNLESGQIIPGGLRQVTHLGEKGVPEKVVVGRFNTASTNPEWYRESGLLQEYGKKRILNVMNKALAGESLTDKQVEIYDDVRNALSEYEFKLSQTVAVMPEAEKIETKEDLAKTIEPSVSETKPFKTSEVKGEKETVFYDDLKEGDTFTINGEDFKVTDKTKRQMTVKDGVTYQLEPDFSPLDIDKGSLGKEEVKPDSKERFVEPTKTIETKTVDEHNKYFGLARNKVDGLTVRDKIPNQSSISASLTEYEILDGVREVPLSLFDESPPDVNTKTSSLADEISESGEINPLIVVVDNEGLYVLEGANRFDAMKIRGAKSIPAMVVLDSDAIKTKKPEIKTEKTEAGDQVTFKPAAELPKGKKKLKPGQKKLTRQEGGLFEVEKPKGKQEGLFAPKQKKLTRKELERADKGGKVVERPVEKEKLERPFVNDGNKLVVKEIGDYKISVDDVNDATHIVLWKDVEVKGKRFDKKVGTFGITKTEDKFLKVTGIDIDKTERGQDFAKKMYEVALQYSHKDIKGIKSYLPNRVNKLQIPKIYKRLGAVEIDDYQYIYKEGTPKKTLKKKQEVPNLNEDFDVNEQKIHLGTDLGRKGTELYHIQSLGNGKDINFYIKAKDKAALQAEIYKLPVKLNDYTTLITRDRFPTEMMKDPDNYGGYGYRNYQGNKNIYYKENKKSDIPGDVEKATPTTDIDAGIKKGEKIDDFGEKIGGARKDLDVKKGKKLGKQIAGWKKKYSILKNKEGTFNLVKISKSRFGGFTTIKTGLATEKEAEDLMPLAEVSSKHRVSLGRKKDDNKYYIYRVIDGRYVKLIDVPFDTEKDGMTYMAKNAEEVINKKFQFPVRPHLDKIERTGKQQRTGDVSPQQFQETFGFRGVEFGNWLPNDERQGVLNFAYDGLLDLANLLNVPPKALTLNGDLAAAFGSRGSGLISAAAHYEPTKAVFNLTRINGAGSLAHEWFHALDNYIGKLSAGSLDKRTEIYATEHYLGTKSRKELRDAFENVINTTRRKKVMQEADLDRERKIFEYSGKSLEEKLSVIKRDLEQDYSDYSYKKRHIKPASKEQIEKFDKLAEKIRKGDIGEKVWVKTPLKRYSQGFYTYKPIQDISEIYKAVRGRTGFAEHGVLGSLNLQLNGFINAKQRWENIQKAPVEEKTVRTNFQTEALEVDKMRASPYWSRLREMGARAFEAYVQDKVEESGDKSQYLVYGAENKYYALLGLKPYPETSERKEINKAFDELFKTIKTKETDKGVEFYQYKRKIPKNERFHRDAAELLSQAVKGIEVVTDQKAFDEIREKRGHRQDTVGIYVSSEKKIYVNPKLATKDTVFHEFAHPVINHVKESDPKLYQQGIDLIKGTKYDKEASELGYTDPLDEGLVQAIGEKGAQIHDTAQRNKFIQWLKKFWIRINRAFKKLFGFNTSLDDFTTMFANEMLSGREILDVGTGKGRKLRRQESRLAPVFYSHAERVVLDKFPNKMGAPSVNNWLAKQQVKPEELEWLDIESLTARKLSITKQELLDWIAGNRVQVEEVTKKERQEYGIPDYTSEDHARLRKLLKEDDYLGFDSSNAAKQAILEHPDWTDRWDVSNSELIELGNKYRNSVADHQTKKAKYSEQQLSGGENYREVLLTLPIKETLPTGITRDAQGKLRDSTGAITIQEEVQKFMPEQGYKSTHWEEPNVLAHVRFNERVDEDGNKVLFIEEIQSDWHQAGKEKGYKSQEIIVSAEKKSEIARSDLKNFRKENNLTVYEMAYGPESPGLKTEWERLRNKVADTDSELNKIKTEMIPNAPFKSEKAWSLLVMKRMIRWGAENGFDKVAWTTGSQQVDRYESSFRRSVDNIKWDVYKDNYKSYPDMREAKAYKNGKLIFHGTIDKDGKVIDADMGEAIGRSLSEVFGKKIATEVMKEPVGDVKGDDLTIGGEGMIEFYDRKLPGYVDKFIKKFGSRVEKTSLQAKDEVDIDVHSFPITDQMREVALGQGFAQFQFLGKKARTADKSLRTKAQQMEKHAAKLEGKKKEDALDNIRKETGWFRGLDDQWRFEIDDSQMDIKFDEMFVNKDEQVKGDIAHISGFNLGDFIKHDELFQAYPELKTHTVNFLIHPHNNNTGSYMPAMPMTENTTISPDLQIQATSKETLRDILLHELQHAVQEIEGFARGGNLQSVANMSERQTDDKLTAEITDLSNTIKEYTELRDRTTNLDDLERLQNEIVSARTKLSKAKKEYIDFEKGILDKYHRLAGEIEARDTGLFRSDLTAEQRLLQKPYLEVDVIGKKNVIVSYGGDGTAKFQIAPSTPTEERPKVPSLYEKKKDDWFGNKEWAAAKATVEANKFEKRIQDSISDKPKFFNGNRKRWTQPLKLEWEQEWQDMARTINVYIDMKRNPDHAEKYYDDLAEDKQKIIDSAQNLNTEQISIANDIQSSYKKIGVEALEAGVIHNFVENYVKRKWNFKDQEQRDEFHRKFGTSTSHAKHRTLDTIIEGWARGFELAIESATNNLQTYKVEIENTIEDKKLIQEAMKIKDKDGDKLFSFKNQSGYAQINHPNFTWWSYSGTLETDPEAEILTKKDRDLIITPEGTILKRKRIYAPKKIADNLNNVLGTSTLMGESGFKKTVAEVTHYNAAIKAMILQTSFFHHLAFTNSFVLGGALESLKDVNVVKSYKKGLKAFEELGPEVELLIRNGLTIGRMQDFIENFARQQTGLTKILDKTMATKAIKEKIILFQEKQARSLFQRYGAGLKVYTALLEYRRMLKHNPTMEPNERAKIVANLTNDDFGGLHLGRLGRDPTAQHVFRLFALAPDWTESNVRSMVKAIKAGSKEETKLYRRLWRRVVVRGMGLTIAANLLLALWDEDDDDKNYKDAVLRRYRTAWDKGYLKWMDVDITPVYRALGGDKDNKSYFSLIGHFRDPIKFVLHPITSAQHKGSVFFRIMFETLKGTDWRGRPFTTWDELFGLDAEKWSPNYKGVYKISNRKIGYRTGDPKGGKLKGSLTKSKYQGRGGPISYEKIPSWMLHEIRQMTPIQVQNFIGYLTGELDGIEAIGKSMGLRMTVSEPYPKKEEKKKPIAQPQKRRKLKRKRIK